MFQNIQEDDCTNDEIKYEETQLNKGEKLKNIVKDLFSIRQIVLYIISFMMSMVGFDMGFTPFALAIVAACASNYVSVGMVFVATAIGTFIKFGASNLLIYILTIAVFTVAILIKRPKVKIDDANEQKKLGGYLIFACLVVNITKMFFTNFYVYDLLSSIANAVVAFVFYKIFANSILVIKDYGIKQAFSVEEVIGASLMLSIAISAFGNFQIFGFSLKNILSILLVMIMGWKNGILVGATTGTTIGVVLGIIGNSNPIMVASYAVCGMIAGVLNRFGKVGVIVGFIVGNGIVAYFTNGNTQTIILIKEILIASLGLLAIPKSIVIDIEDLFGKTKYLPNNSGRVLEANKETILKLNNMSETISEIARSYDEAAATTLEINETKQLKQAREIFLEELQNSMIGDEENILFEDITSKDSEIAKDIFNKLIEKEEIEKGELIEIFAKYNNFIVGFESEELEEDAAKDILKAIKAINYTYKISKLSYVWKMKIDEEKKLASNQLEGVSKAISSLAQDIRSKSSNKYSK